MPSPIPGPCTPRDECDGGCGRKRRRYEEEDGGLESSESSSNDGVQGGHSRSEVALEASRGRGTDGGDPPRPPSQLAAAATDAANGDGTRNDDDGGGSPARRSPRQSVANKKPRLENGHNRDLGDRTRDRDERTTTTTAGRTSSVAVGVTFSSDLTTTHTTYSSSEYDRTPAPPPDDLYDCDVCGLTILPGGEFGRYTCTECDDYDVCSMCYEAATTTTKMGGTSSGVFGWDHEHDAVGFEYVPPVDDDDGEEQEEEENDEDGDTLTRTRGPSPSSTTTTRELKGGEAEV